MSITQALANATSGLNAASLRAGVTSNNIANALTPGFARRDVVLGERAIEGRGAGVGVNGIVRATTPQLTADRRDAGASTERLSVVNQAQQQFTQAVGGPGDPASLFSSFETLEASLTTLTNTPESGAAQSTVINATNDLIQYFADLNLDATVAQAGADQEIDRTVNTLNQSLEQIVEVNRSIEIAVVNGRETAALEDRRGQLIDVVSSEIPVNLVQDRNGKVDIITKEGVFLIRGDARQIEFSSSSDTNPNATLSGLSVEGQNVTPGESAQSIRDGRLAGLFQVRDQVAPDFSAQLDELADDLVARFANLNDSSQAPGGLALIIDSTSEGPAIPGLAGRLQLNPAVDPNQGGSLTRLRDGFGATQQGSVGDNANPIALLNALTQTVESSLQNGTNFTGSAIDFVAEFSTTQSTAALATDTSLITANARFESLSNAELNQTGVDTDRELRNLIEIEQAFSANARVIEVADRLVQRLLDI